MPASFSQDGAAGVSRDGADAAETSITDFDKAKVVQSDHWFVAIDASGAVCAGGVT
jgi:hypothetical protein